MWNYSIDSVNLFDCMDKEEISELEAILVEYLDEDTIFGSQEELLSHQIPRCKKDMKKFNLFDKFDFTKEINPFPVTHVSAIFSKAG